MTDSAPKQKKRKSSGEFISWSDRPSFQLSCSMPIQLLFYYLLFIFKYSSLSAGAQKEPPAREQGPDENAGFPVNSHTWVTNNNNNYYYYLFIKRKYLILKKTIQMRCTA